MQIHYLFPYMSMTISIQTRLPSHISAMAESDLTREIFQTPIDAPSFVITLATHSLFREQVPYLRPLPLTKKKWSA